MRREDKMKSILFLHGWATDGAVWEGQLAAFSEEYRCRALTLPGHGDGVAWRSPTLAPAVDSLIASLEEYGREDGVVAVG